jgi:hypothetical protein
MRMWFGLAGFMLLGLGASNVAHAQPVPARQAVQHVGFCDMHITQQRMALDEVTTQWANGFVEKALFLLPPRPHPYAPPPTPIAVAPDPSGLNFLAIRSAVNGVQFWVRWDDFRVISIAANGHTQAVGDCAIDRAFAGLFYRPPPWSLPPTTGVSVELDGRALAPNAMHLSALPEGVYQEGIYNAPPVMATKTLAERCVASSLRDEDAFYRCVIGGAMGEKERRAYECANASKTPQETALCLLADNLGSEEQKRLQEVRACYRQHGNNWNQYPTCLAAASVDPKVMNLVSCARQNFQAGQEPNYWNLGLCALGPQVFKRLNPNPEASIAIQCAVQTGGQPKLFVACAGGQLAIRELDKCLTDGFGEGGCFGKNNTLTKLYDRVGDGIAEAFGRKSLVYQAWQAATISSNPAEAIKAVNQVAREVNKAGDNITAEAKRGLDKAGEAVSQIVPQVKVGKPKGKIFGKKWSF